MSYQRLHEVRKEVARGYVYERPVGNLSLFKYTEKCVYDKAWNKTNERCRGIVFDTNTGTIVCKPFQKFFNIGERPNTSMKVLAHKIKRMGTPQATVKIDGSMVAIFYYDGEWRTATPGSLESPQAQYAKRKLLPKYHFGDLPTDLTYVCEMIAPWDRECKVCQYGDRDELIILAAFETKWEQVEAPRQRVISLAETAGLSVVDEFLLDPDNPMGTPITDGDEGYVAKFDDGFRVKIKSRWFMHWHRLADQVSYKNVAELLESAAGDVAYMLKEAPETIRDKVDDVAGYIKAKYQRIEIETDKVWAQVEDPEDYKACALMFQQHGPVQAVLFARMRGREEAPVIWKLVKKELIAERKIAMEEE